MVTQLLVYSSQLIHRAAQTPFALFQDVPGLAAYFTFSNSSHIVIGEGVFK